MQFQELLNADAGAFDEAASSFKHFGQDVRDNAIDYRSQVAQQLNDDQLWRGKAATAAKRPMGDLQLALNRAAEQLEAVPKLLREHGEQLAELQARLKGIVANAREVGIDVSNTGGVTVPADVTERAAQAKMPDPLKAVMEDIRGVLDAASELDMDTADALRKILTAEPLDAHQVGADYRDAVKDARRAAELLDKLNDDPFNKEHRAELLKLLKEHGEDSEFATTLLTKLGGRGSMDALALVAFMGNAEPSLYPGERPSAAELRALQARLGGVLALGTNPDSPFHVDMSKDSEWMKDFRAAGKDKLDIGLTDRMQPYGYQLLGAALHSGKYSTEFLNAVGSDMYEMDKDGRFQANAPNTALNLSHGDINFIDDVGAGFDPINGLMLALEENPEAATDFFAGENESRIGHLLDRDDWADDGIGGANRVSPDDSSQALVIDALAAASGGAQPGTEGFGIAKETVNHLGETGGEGLSNDQARESMGRLLQGQLVNVNDALGQGKWGFDPGAMSRVLGDVAHSPEAYARLANAERAFTASQMEQIMGAYNPSAGDTPAGVRADLADKAENMGRMLAHLNEGKEDAIRDRWDNEAGTYNDRVDDIGELGGYALGKAVAQIPGADLLVGPALDRIMEGARVDYSEYADADAARMHDKSRSEAADMVEQVVWENGLYETDEKPPHQLMYNDRPIPLADMTPNQLDRYLGWKSGNDSYEDSVQRTLNDIGDAYPNGSTSAGQSQGGR